MKEFKFLEENNEVAPSYGEDVLYIELEDTDTGEHFGIPAHMDNEISQRGRNLYNVNRTVSGRCNYNEDYAYWIENVYHTVDHTLVIEIWVSIPRSNGTSTYRKYRKIIPHD